jgi:ComF family protein
LIAMLRRLFRCFFYPQVCCLCQSWVHFEDPRPLCDRCLTSLRRLDGPLCPVCGIPVPTDILGEGYVCSSCRKQAPPFDKARAWGLYGDLLRKTIHHFKFEGLRHLDIPLGNLLAEVFNEHFSEEHPEILVPIPIHPRRHRERGYDQTLLLARRLSRLCGLPIDRSTHRCRHTSPQFGLNLGARRSNLRGAFSIDPGHQLTGRRILIVDDVMTTGTTVGELGKLIKRSARPEWLGVLTVARVFHYSD